VVGSVSARRPSNLPSEVFEKAVETALKDMLGEGKTLDAETRVKLLNVCVRWAAVKNKLVMPEHGEGFDGDAE